MRAAALLLAVLAWPAQAAWEWSAPLTVNSVQGVAIFPHLESANRRGVAVSGDTVGVVWEDNRSGRPQLAIHAGSRPASQVWMPMASSPSSIQPEKVPQNITPSASHNSR
ncbi:MAG: hypothetical protein M1449_13515, partial [Candidatus Thermoplasmatota archaeon]|nr:hypothetical protein [Candidatus Thermoplasmatota archaeon]